MKNHSLLNTILVLTCVARWAPAQPAPAPNNSQVRFHFFHGSTSVGDVTVELFDHDKTATVQNFLRYVREGAYDNLILQRCVPNFVIQAGSARSLRPTSTGGFYSYIPTYPHDPVTNEFDVGPRLSNVFGTLAMAKRDGDPDSAQADWFFNLADNSVPLDYTNGGFTVFGRVIAGTNVLVSFNHLRSSLGIVDLRTYYGEGAAMFADLPVAYNPTTGRYPRIVDLYHVQVTLLTGATDRARPTVKIVSPVSAGIRFSNELLTVTGTAKDDVGVGMVWYSLNNSEPTNAVGTTNWSAVLALEPGTNYFYAQSVDFGGRRSTAVTRTFFRSVPMPITVSRVGAGVITGPTNGQLLEINRFYALSAKPAARHMFMSWAATWDGGAQTYAPPKIKFVMWSNMTWTATFVTNPFPPLKGTYVGTVFNTNFFTTGDTRLNESLAAVTFTVTDLGKVSGKLRQGTGAYPFTGSFRPDGSASISVKRTGKSALILKLNLDVTNRSETVTGSLSDDETFLSWLQGERAAKGTKLQPVSWAGRFTALLPGGTNATTAPPGQGPTAVTVGATGTLALSGTLPDGTPFTYSTAVSTNGRWPMYVPLYKGKGAVFAWAQFDSNLPPASLSGFFAWIKRAGVAGKLYPDGFVVTNDLTGSAYRAPVGSTNRVLSLTDASVVFTDGDFSEPLTNQVALSAGGVATNLGPNALTLTITKLSGLFSGSLKPVGATKAIPFKGAVLQNANQGAGYFLGTNQAGRVFLGP